MLNQLLETLGIHDFSSLTEEEKATYKAWAQTLTAPEMTLEDVKMMLANEHQRAQVELEKWDNPTVRRVFFQALSHLSGTLKLFIETPIAQREALRAHLKQTFKVEI